MTVAGAEGVSGTEYEFSGGTDGTLCCWDMVVEDATEAAVVEIVEGTNP